MGNPPGVQITPQYVADCTGEVGNRYALGQRGSLEMPRVSSLESTDAGLGLESGKASRKSENEKESE